MNRRFEMLAPIATAALTKALSRLPGRAAKGLGTTALGGLAGASLLAGVAIGVLFAPQTGEVTRGQLMSRIGTLRETLTSKLGSLAPSADVAAQEAEDAEVSAPPASRATQSSRASHNGNGRRASKPARA